MENKQSAAIATIRQACFSGLPSRSAMPIVAAQMRNLVPAACCQFTWSGAAGRITNFWCDTFMPRRTAWIILNHRRYEADAGFSFREMVLFGKSTGNARAWWAQGFEHSATFGAVFAPYGFKWFLDGVVRDAERPYGCLALIRHATQPDFSAAEEELLARVLPYLLHTLRADAVRPSRFVRTGRSGMVVCDAQGQVVEWSASAHRLAVYALVDEINLDARVEGGDFAEMTQRLREIALQWAACMEAGDASDELPSLVRRNGWGEFVLRGYRLRGPDGAANRVGILIEQLVPIDSHLLERINATPLTTRQKEIALLSLKGLPNAQIARQLSISPHTLKDYFKGIYARLEINSHHELVQRLAFDDLAAAA